MALIQSALPPDPDPPLDRADAVPELTALFNREKVHESCTNRTGSPDSPADMPAVSMCDKNRLRRKELKLLQSSAIIIIQSTIDTPHAITNAPGDVNDAIFMADWPTDARAICAGKLFALYDDGCTTCDPLSRFHASGFLSYLTESHVIFRVNFLPARIDDCLTILIYGMCIRQGMVQMFATVSQLVAERPRHEADGRREQARTPVARPSTVRAGDRAPHAVIVEDLSATGCRFSAARMFTVGSRVSIGLSGAGSAIAIILWHEGRRYGCQFDPPLTDRAVADAFRTSARTVLTFLESGAALPEPEVARWSPRHRMMVLAGLVTASWSLITIGVSAIL